MRLLPEYIVPKTGNALSAENLEEEQNWGLPRIDQTKLHFPKNCTERRLDKNWQT